MNATFNLPNGCLASDLDGEPMPKCTDCGSEHNNYGDLCDECKSKKKPEIEL